MPEGEPISQLVGAVKSQTQCFLELGTEAGSMEKINSTDIPTPKFLSNSGEKRRIAGLPKQSHLLAIKYRGGDSYVWIYSTVDPKTQEIALLECPSSGELNLSFHRETRNEMGNNSSSRWESRKPTEEDLTIFVRTLTRASKASRKADAPKSSTIH